MMEKVEAAFEYIAEHPAVLMIVGGMFFAFISIFTTSMNDDTTSFLRILGISLIVGGVLLHILYMGLRFLVRLFQRLFHIDVS